MSERREAEEAASLALVEAGLDELFTRTEERSGELNSLIPSAPQGRAAPRWWPALAAAAVVLVVVGGFIWSEARRGDEGGVPRRGVAAENLEVEPEISVTPLRAISEISSLDPRTRGVSVRISEFGDEDLRALVARCPHLELLSLDTVDVSNQGLAALRSLANLRELSLPCCARLSDDCLPLILELGTLCALDLTGFVGQVGIAPGQEEDYVSPFSKFTSAGLATLGQHPSLTRLILAGTQIDDEGVALLAARAPRIDVLDLSMTATGPAGLQRLAELHSLRELRYLDQSRLGDEVAIALANLPQLRRLEMGASGFRDASLGREGIAAIARANRLEYLRLDRCSKIGVEGYRLLAQMTSLTELGVEGAHALSAEDLRALGHGGQLEVLNLSRGNTQAGVDHIAALAEGFPALRELRLARFPSDEADAALRRLLRERSGKLVVRDGQGRAFPRAYLRVVLAHAEGASPKAGFAGSVVAVLDATATRVIDLLQGQGYASRVLPGAEFQTPGMAGATLYESAGLGYGTYVLEIASPGRALRRQTVRIDAEGAKTLVLNMESAVSRMANWITRRTRLTLGGGGPIPNHEIGIVATESESRICRGFTDEMVRDCETADRALISLGEMQIMIPHQLRIYRAGEVVDLREFNVPEDRSPLRVEVEQR